LAANASADGAADGDRSKYADVICLRWMEFTGQEATLDGHGATLNTSGGRRMQAEDEIKEDCQRLLAERGK